MQTWFTNLLPALSEHYLTLLSVFWVEFCCYASTGGSAVLWLQVASIPAFLHLLILFFVVVVKFPHYYFIWRQNRVGVWMFLVLLQLWHFHFSITIFILVTCLPKWAWESCKNTPSYCPLKMAFSHQKNWNHLHGSVSKANNTNFLCLHLFFFFLDIPFLRASLEA